MTVAFDAASMSGVGQSSATPLEWTHTPAGTPKGAMVFVYQASGIGSTTTTVTYGGVSLSRVGFATQLSGGEGGNMSVYYLGAGLPSGAQTISIDDTGGDRWAGAVTVTAADDTEIVAADTIISTSQADPTFTFDTGVREALRFFGAAADTNGVDSIVGQTGSTFVNASGTSTRGGYVIRADAAASGSASVGAVADANDIAAFGFAVAEVDATQVQHDATTVGASFTTVTPNTFDHTPIGTPKAVCVYVYESGALDPVTSITYGGVAMTRVIHVASVGASEPGSTTLYFLGEGIPAGTQTVSIAHTGSGNTKQAVCETFTAPADTFVVVSDSLNTNSEQFPSLTLNSAADAGLMVFGGASGNTGNEISTGDATLLTAFGVVSAKGWIYGRAPVERTGSQSLGFKNRAGDEAFMVGAVIAADNVPVSGGGSRMGGTGAIRKPPRNVRR